jgi:TnpA family transposase
MCRLLGFRFAPRIRDLKEKRLYVLPGMTLPPELASLAGGAINLRVISDHWFELLRLALSIKTGTVTASVILRKLAAFPRQNGLALALLSDAKLFANRSALFANESDGYKTTSAPSAFRCS